AERVAEQAETLPAERVGRRQHVAEVIDVVIPAAGRAMIGTAVTRQVDSDNVEMFTKQQSQSVERCGIVEPAVQGQQARQRRVAPGARCQTQLRQAHGNLASGAHTDSRAAVESAALSIQPAPCRRISASSTSTWAAVALSAGM